MQSHLYDPLVLLHTALASQSCVAKAHSSVSKRKDILVIEQVRGPYSRIFTKLFSLPYVFLTECLACSVRIFF